MLSKYITAAALALGIICGVKADEVCDPTFADGLLIPQLDTTPTRSLAQKLFGDYVVHGENFPGLPPFISGMNGLGVVEFETLQFASALIAHTHDLQVKGVESQIKFKLAKFNITKLSDYFAFYTGDFTQPNYIANNNTEFLSDAFFGRSRLLFYSAYIKLYENSKGKLPFKLTDADITGVLPAGETLASALQAKKLYVEDHTDIAYLAKHLATGKHIGFPIILFYKTTGGPLIPVAIKLDPSSDIVATPKDGAIWTFSKIVGNFICSQRAVGGTHFLDHYALIPLTTSYYRKLASNHPVRVILSHFLRQNIGVTTFGTRTLLPKNTGYFDTLTAFGRDAALELMAGIYKDVYKFFASAPENEISSRKLEGLMDDFPFYTTAKQYYAAFTSLVRNLVFSAIMTKLIQKILQMLDLINVYYSSDSAVTGDVELQAFAADLANVAKLPGFPSSFKTRESVAAFLAQAFYVASFRHGVVGTGDMGWSTSLPMSGLSLYKPMPSRKTDVTDSNIISWLPSVSKAIQEIQFIASFRRVIPATWNLYGAFNALATIGVPAVKSSKTACIFDRYTKALDKITESVAKIAQDPIIKGWDVMAPANLPSFVFN
ncbi:Mitogen-activated protein kinase 4a [Phlyctochytrium planicorne]|nr:Mitogen-activated protein kinase 4a [Phlyctochytrium planicorne]